jgi:polyribonucleotide nucleotidyltransferase
VLAGGLEACKVWIKESIALQRQLVASVIATNGPITPLPSPGARLRPDVFAAVERSRRRRAREAITIAGKAERNAATDAAAAKATRSPSSVR